MAVASATKPSRVHPDDSPIPFGGRLHGLPLFCGRKPAVKSASASGQGRRAKGDERRATSNERRATSDERNDRANREEEEE
jgi:hypothetical protein